MADPVGGLRRSSKLRKATWGWVGWQHHVALCLLAGAFLLSLQQALGKKMPKITRSQNLPSCKRGYTGWCEGCCPGNGSGRMSCCDG